jgi:hypothetical protein
MTRKASHVDYTNQWTSVQAYTVCVVCLTVGLRGVVHPRLAECERGCGRGKQFGFYAGHGRRHRATDSGADPAYGGQAGRTSARTAETDPDNPDLLGKVGNIYCYTQQFPTAIEYYQRSGSSSWQAISIRCLPRTPAETGRTHLSKIATTQDAEIADQIEARRAQLEGLRLILRRHLDMRPSVVTSRRCRQRGALRFTT